MLANLAYNKAEKRGSRDRSSLLSDQDLDIAALPERRAAILILTTPGATLTGSRLRIIKRFSSRRL
jgi:hypothetical protein